MNLWKLSINGVISHLLLSLLFLLGISLKDRALFFCGPWRNRFYRVDRFVPISRGLVSLGSSRGLLGVRNLWESRLDYRLGILCRFHWGVIRYGGRRSSVFCQHCLHLRWWWDRRDWNLLLWLRLCDRSTVPLIPFFSWRIDVICCHFHLRQPYLQRVIFLIHRFIDNVLCIWRFNRIDGCLWCWRIHLYLRSRWCCLLCLLSLFCQDELFRIFIVFVFRYRRESCRLLIDLVLFYFHLVGSLLRIEIRLIIWIIALLRLW